MFEVAIDDARTIHLALIAQARVLREEYEKLANTPEISALLIEAATDNYNRVVRASTELHVRLVQHFPELGAPAS